MQLRPVVMLAIWLLLGAAVSASAESVPIKGDVHELTLTSDSVDRSSDGSSQGSSHDQDSIIERVIAVGANGVELEYDLPPGTSTEQRSSQWQFPVRILKLPNGELRLLNSSELESRLDSWLKAAGWSRAICGHWVFTWTGFKIECDPQSALKDVEAFDMTSVDLRDGALYRDPDAVSPGQLTRRRSEHGNFFSTELQVDSNAVRRAQAQTDVAIGEVTRKPVTLDAALRKHATDKVTGTISVTFETDAAGNPVRRTRITKLLTKEANGGSRTRTITDVLERKALSAH